MDTAQPVPYRANKPPGAVWAGIIFPEKAAATKADVKAEMDRNSSRSAELCRDLHQEFSMGVLGSFVDSTAIPGRGFSVHLPDRCPHCALLISDKSDHARVAEAAKVLHPIFTT